MTPSEITSLNLQCAERLGWKNVHQLNKWKEGGPQKDGTLVADFNGLRRLSVPDFHGSLDAALHLVAKAKEMGFRCTLDNCVHWSCVFSRYDREQETLEIHEDEHETSLSAAICLAFLKLPQ